MISALPVKSSRMSTPKGLPVLVVFAFNDRTMPANGNRSRGLDRSMSSMRPSLRYLLESMTLRNLSSGWPVT